MPISRARSHPVPADLRLFRNISPFRHEGHPEYKTSESPSPRSCGPDRSDRPFPWPDKVRSGERGPSSGVPPPHLGAEPPLPQADSFPAVGSGTVMWIGLSPPPLLQPRGLFSLPKGLIGPTFRDLPGGPFRERCRKAVHRTLDGDMSFAAVVISSVDREQASTRDGGDLEPGGRSRPRWRSGLCGAPLRTVAPANRAGRGSVTHCSHVDKRSVQNNAFAGSIKRDPSPGSDTASSRRNAFRKTEKTVSPVTPFCATGLWCA